MLSEPAYPAQPARVRTAHEIDQALAEWKRRLAAIANNLLDLQAHPAYQLLTAPDTVLAGITAARVRPALAAVPRMFEHFGLVHTTIERAAALRAANPVFFNAESRLREAAALLFGRSIHLADSDIPLDQRSLITAGRSSEDISAEALLATMSTAFTTARDVVLAVDRAWTTLAPALTQAEVRLAALTTQSVPPSCSASPSMSGPLLQPSELTAAAQALATLNTRLRADPLGVERDFSESLEVQLTRLEQQAAAAARLDHALAEARTALANLRAAERETASVHADVRARITPCTALAPCTDAAATLEQWLDRLCSLRNGTHQQALEVGLRQWSSACAHRLLEERERTAAQRAPLEARYELRGRLDALRAKARRLALHAAEPLRTQAEAAAKLLFFEPTDLANATRAVAVYEHMLTGAARAPEAQPR